MDKPALGIHGFIFSTTQTNISTLDVAVRFKTVSFHTWQLCVCRGPLSKNDVHCCSIIKDVKKLKKEGKQMRLIEQID